VNNKKRATQLTLLLIGLLLFGATYLIYPNVKNDKFAIEKEVNKNFEKNSSEGKTSTFENIEYVGLYNFDKPFVVKSEKAHILKKDPNVIFMKNMYVNLNLGNGREVIILSNEGTYNKKTFDCFFEKNVRATDGNTKIFSENLDLLASQNTAKIYNNVRVIHASGDIQADKIDYNFETKNFNVSMFDDKTVKVKVVQ